MKRTSSSSCQCSALNLASIASSPGVSAVTSITSAVVYPPRALSVSIFVEYAARTASPVAPDPMSGPWLHRSKSMPCLARYAVTDSSSVSVWFSSGILTSAMMLLPVHNRTPAANRFEQELEDLDVALGVSEGIAPRVQTMAPQHERVGISGPVERLGHAFGEPGHVLIVLDDGNPLAVLMRPHVLEALEHLVAFDAQPPIGRVEVGEHGGPDRMSMQHGAGPAKSRDLDVQQRLGGRSPSPGAFVLRASAPGVSTPGISAPDEGTALVALEDITSTELVLVDRAGGDR